MLDNWSAVRDEIMHRAPNAEFFQLPENKADRNESQSTHTSLAVPTRCVTGGSMGLRVLNKTPSVVLP